MSKKHKRKKSDIKTWAVGAITDLIIGIILLIISKLFE